jgi:hypothetical protein
VKVTRRRMTITLRDERGRPVKGADGKDCGPYVVEREQ